ncbi:hypothetical protein [Paenibacillus sacheonensis]|uniref:Uncharacterized protein n=1 Tax=Paenibacillus sacheonensis TaxID=742054 RepID=A0A7X4YV83_9BACL|nr:hypothetical protein [Paenibacillus sacheonensis]MBM7568020.1 hypothetical protein [Paenibacillus sacheonensis]NBC73226.1 hypothetical protein [Paenibacillus sacheonensis]
MVRKLGFACFLFLLLGIAYATAASAASYYISSTGCSDSYAGTAGAAAGGNGPWCSLTKVNGKTFAAGDQILLNRGSSWSGQQMVFTNSGTSGNPITLADYGSSSSARPKIIGGGGAGERMVKLTNPSYWNVRNLEVSNAGVGIYVYYSTLSHEGLNFENIYVHDIRGIWAGHTTAYPGPLDASHPFDPTAQGDAVFMSAGILLTGNPALSFTDSQYAARNISFIAIEGTHNVDSVSIDPWNGLDSTTAGSNGNSFFQNITLKDLYLHDDDGHSGAAYQSAIMGCSDSLRFSSVRNVLVLNSTLNNEASCHTSLGTAAIILQRAKDVRIVNTLLTNVPNTSSPDQTAMDQEFSTENVTVSHSYIAGNAGPGLEILNIHGEDPDDRSINTVYTGNLFSQNGDSSIKRLAGGTTPVSATGTFSHNLYYEPGHGLLNGSGTFTLTNNISLSQTGYYAAAGFGGTQGSNQWLYQYKSGGAWTNLPSYDAANKWWYQNAATPWLQRVGKFDMHPGNCAACDVARVWKAPSSGTVSLRGQLLKWDIGGGDGIMARITKQSGGTVTQLWPSTGDYALGAADQVGTATDLDNVTVAADDLIRFEIGSGTSGNESYDNTSWVPSVAYTTISGGGTAFDWGFNTAGNTDGWSAINQVTQSVSGGINALTSSGGDPYLFSPDNLNFSASSFPYVRIRLQNTAAGGEGRLYFTTTADTSWSEAKRVTFYTIPSASGYTEYVLNMGANARWSGTIKQLRFDPISATGTVNVDYIRVTGGGSSPSFAADYNFGSSAEGWTVGHTVTQSVSGGINTLTLLGNDAYIYSPDNLGINASTYTYIRIRLKNNTGAEPVKFYYTTTADTSWSEAKSLTFLSSANGDYAEYLLYVGGTNWSGTIKQLRFDPIDEPGTSIGTVDVDYIRVSDR